MTDRYDHQGRGGTAPESPRPGHAREQLERLYREIGIPAVAAAVQAARPGVAAEPAVHDLPAYLKDHVRAA